MADLDIIFASSSIATASSIIKQVGKLRITVAIATDDIWKNSTIIESADAGSEGAVIFTFFDEAEPANDETVTLTKDFKEYPVKEKQENTVPAISILGYNPYPVATKAVGDAGFTDTTAIRDAPKNVGVDGVTENIILSEIGDVNKDIVSAKTIKDGRSQFPTTTTME